MRLRRNQIFGLAGGVLLLALLPPSACKRRSLGGEDAGVGQGQGGSAGGLASLDGGAGQGGSPTGGTGGAATGGTGGPATGGTGGPATGGTGGTIVLPDAALDTGRDTGAETRRDAPIEGPPPPGFIPCGANSCDPAREFCKHDVSGLTADQRVCWPLPTGCEPDGTACACLLNDPGWRFCHACRVVSGVDVMGLELDCPGAVG